MIASKIQTKVLVQDMVIEITRRCNMACEHCLRGDAQALDITREQLFQIFQPVSSVGVLAFSGGEPSLRPELLMEALEVAKLCNVAVDQVYIVTNGKEVSDKFLEAVRAWDSYTYEHSYYGSSKSTVGYDAAYRIVRSLIDSNEDREYGAWVSLSMDCFHEEIPVSNIYKLASLPHLTCDKYQGDRSGRWVISEGRALENGLGEQTLQELRPWYFGEKGRVLEVEEVDEEDHSYAVEEVMFGANGNVLKTCDASYETQEEIAHFKLSDLEPGETWADREIKMFLEKEG